MPRICLWSSTTSSLLAVGMTPTRTTARRTASSAPLANDFLTEEEFNQRLHAWFGNLARALLPGRSFYVWGGYSNLGTFPPVLKRCGLYFSQGIVWDKQHPVLTSKDFMGAQEWCFYGWKLGALLASSDSRGNLRAGPAPGGSSQG